MGRVLCDLICFDLVRGSPFGPVLCGPLFVRFYVFWSVSEALLHRVLFGPVLCGTGIVQFDLVLDSVRRSNFGPVGCSLFLCGSIWFDSVRERSLWTGIRDCRKGLSSTW